VAPDYDRVTLDAGCWAVKLTRNALSAMLPASGRRGLQKEP
jgi:hypothetical protein